MHPGFTVKMLQAHCSILGKQFSPFNHILQQYGYPPYWNRTASFATLVHIILEQQVSLASARAAFLKLQQAIGQVTPENLLQLSDEALRACYFSRQKAGYARELAQAVQQKKLVIEKLHRLPDDAVRLALTAVKGIGNWTADVFLMMALHRPDCFPAGDIALLSSIKETLHLPAATPRTQLLLQAEAWRPYRTAAAFLLWHAYLCKRNIRL